MKAVKKQNIMDVHIFKNAGNAAEWLQEHGGDLLEGKDQYYLRCWNEKAREVEYLDVFVALLEDNSKYRIFVMTLKTLNEEFFIIDNS